MDSELLVSGVASLVGMSIYSYLGWRLSHRAVGPATRVPALQFALFWVGLATFTAIGAVEDLVGAFQLPSLDLVVTAGYLQILILCVLLWCLVGYLLFLFLGRGFLGPLAGFYAVLYVLLVYFITASHPVAVVHSAGQVGVQYASALSGPVIGALLVLLIAPEFLGAIGYFTLFFRTRDPTIRYRIALVSWSLILWFGLGVTNVGALLGGGVAAELLARSLGVIAAVVILLAYFPPAAIRARFRVTRIDESSAA